MPRLAGIWGLLQLISWLVTSTPSLVDLPADAAVENAIFSKILKEQKVKENLGHMEKCFIGQHNQVGLIACTSGTPSGGACYLFSPVFLCRVGAANPCSRFAYLTLQARSIRNIYNVLQLYSTMPIGFSKHWNFFLVGLLSAFNVRPLESSDWCACMCQNAACTMLQTLRMLT